MLLKITSRSNEKIKHVVSLREKKNRLKEGLFVAEGKRSLEMALKAKLVKEVYSLEELRLPKDIFQYIIDESVLEKISSLENPDGVVFVCETPSLKIEKKDKLLYLDNLQDPGNVGTLIRTALGLGFDGVILSRHSCDPFNDKAISASKGSIFSLPVIFDDLFNYADTNRIIVSTLSDDSVPLDEVNIKDPFILVLGNEGNGVSKESLELADLKVKIPMKIMESLNVSIAGAILMYELSK